MKIKTFEFNNFSVNTYLLYDETGEAALIDCGCMYPEEEAKLSRVIRENDLKPMRLLCTHLHLDHILGNPFIRQTYGLDPEAHPADIAGLPTPEQQAAAFGIRLARPSVPVGHELKEGETIRFGRMTLSVIHVPGHSPGGVVFYDAEDGAIFAGDALFCGSIGRTDLWNGDHEELIDGIRNKLLTLPDDTIVFPGHGPSTTIGFEKKHNPFL